MNCTSSIEKVIEYFVHEKGRKILVGYINLYLFNFQINKPNQR
jgi:hypothetical protein